jgi:hypothetical protein
MADIFISYKREDQEEHGRVAPIAQALRAEGYDVFYDVQVPPGSSWERVLQDKMDQARCVLVLWSSASVGSDWVKEEAEMAKHDGKLIPVFLDPVSPPFGFARIEGADLSGWDGDLSHIEWQNLVAAVRTRIGAGEGDTAPGVSRVSFTPSRTEHAEMQVPDTGSGGGMGKWLAGAIAVLALAAVGFFGLQMYENNQRMADRAEDEATAEAMTRGIDERAWQEAKTTDTIASYRRYLDARPTGAYRKDALTRIDELEKADEAEAAGSPPSPEPGTSQPNPPQPAGPADLVIAGLELSTRELTPGEQFRAKVQVRNIGATTAPGSGENGYMIDFVLSRDATAPVRSARFQESWSEDAMLRGGRASNTEPIAPDAYREISTSLEVPADWPAGRFNLCAVVDPGGRVEEASTGNNVRCTGVSVTANTPPAPRLDEDCLGYGGGFELRRSGSRIAMVSTGRPGTPLSFTDDEEAKQALVIVSDYKLDTQCFVGRPDPGLAYWKSNGRLPSGRIDGEDCLPVNAGNLSVKVAGGMSLVMDGGRSMMRFRERADAGQAIDVMKALGARQICYVGRPDPSMTYLKR